MIDWNAKPMGVMNSRIEKLGPDGCIFDLNKIYHDIKDWFAEAKYSFTEKENTTKKKDKGTEIKMTLIGKRSVTDYFQFMIEIKFLIIETEPVKFKNKKLYKGKFRAYFKAALIFDYRYIWAKNKFSKLLRYIYNNFIIFDKIDNVYSAALKFEADDLFNVVKEDLEMYNQ